jgi:DNA adenine methylase
VSRADTQPGLGAAPAAPFLKWAGGKGRLLAQFDPLFPRSFRRYIEPFVGGGAVFFYLHNLGRLGHGAVLSDRNPELMNTWRAVQNPELLPRLIQALEEHAGHVLDRDYYHAVRGWDRQASFRDRSAVDRAARTLFLNKTCYNGLYRLNKRGQFNVPYGKWARPPRLFREETLWACHRALQGVTLVEEDFPDCMRRAREGDFVYLDPPYHPLSPTASFTTYTGSEFRESDQRRLAELFRELAGRGCLVMMSNSATPLIRSLYKGFRRETVRVGRAISCRGSGRGEIDELVVLNT